MCEIIELETNEQVLRLHISDRPTHWANGILVEVFDTKGNFVNAISYSAHPEFENFEFYKDMERSEINAVVLSRIRTDIESKDFKLGAANGMRLFLPLNRKI